MKQNVTTGIVLSRLNYGEADRIITWLTPDHGKISLIAKGVRKQKSKLAGGIELFSESNISFIWGRGDVGTLTSSRLITNFANISKDLNRTKLGFEFLSIVNKTVEEKAGSEWYQMLSSTIADLNNIDLEPLITELWLNLQWLKLSGHSPNLHLSASNKKLSEQDNYLFDFEKMAFVERPDGPYGANHIKLLRLGISVAKPKALAYVQNTKKLLPACASLTKTMLKTFVQI